MAALTTIVLDKTGTLTVPGAGSVVWQGQALSEVDQCKVYSLARHSTHPLAVRLCETVRAGETRMTVQSFVEASGRGMGGEIDGQPIRMGSEEWLGLDGGVEAGRSAPRAAASRTEAGKGVSAEKKPSLLHSAGTVPNGSTVHVSMDGKYRGCFVLESALRPEVSALVQRLRGTYELVLLSGDNSREAERFRSLLGPEARVEFNQSPLDKLNVIRELQASHRKVMMVGDGLNDAGALKQADVGVAVVEKVGTFSPASDVILDAAHLPRLAEVLEFARSSAWVVRAGFVVSGLYNVVGISIAAAGLLSPVVCAILMPLSSATVVAFTLGATGWMARQHLGVRRSFFAPDGRANGGADQALRETVAVPAAGSLSRPRSTGVDSSRLMPVPEEAIR